MNGDAWFLKTRNIRRSKKDDPERAKIVDAFRLPPKAQAGQKEKVEKKETDNAQARFAQSVMTGLARSIHSTGDQLALKA